MYAVYSTILEDRYDAVLTVLEFFLQEIAETRKIKKSEAYEHFNSIFEREFVGYRFIDDLIAPITDEIEVEEMSAAFVQVGSGVKVYLPKALRLLV